MPTGSRTKGGTRVGAASCASPRQQRGPRRRRALRLVQLKNPWKHRSWRGRFSASDTSSWTAGLRRQLAFDQREAQQYEPVQLSMKKQVFAFIRSKHPVYPNTRFNRKSNGT